MQLSAKLSFINTITKLRFWNEKLKTTAIWTPRFGSMGFFYCCTTFTVFLGRACAPFHIQDFYFLPLIKTQFSDKPCQHVDTTEFDPHFYACVYSICPTPLSKIHNLLHSVHSVKNYTFRKANQGFRMASYIADIFTINQSFSTPVTVSSSKFNGLTTYTTKNPVEKSWGIIKINEIAKFWTFHFYNGSQKRVLRSRKLKLTGKMSKTQFFDHLGIWFFRYAKTSCLYG